MKVVDIANEIYLENASPSDTSIAAIAYWIRSNVGKLNTLIYVDCDGAEINELAAAIIKMMYKVYRTDLDIRANLFSMQNDSVIAANDDGFSIKKINRSEVLKTLTSFKKDTVKEMYDLVHGYRSYNGAPSQVAGDDTTEGHYVGIPSPFTRNVVGSSVS
jgi:hypothetical protein